MNTVIDQLLDPVQVIKHILVLSSNYELEIDVAHFEKIHPVISGNKYFKLAYNIQKFEESLASQLISYGGKNSNHLHSLAYICNLLKIPSIGYIRNWYGEKTPTLIDCDLWNMKLLPLSSEQYRKEKKQEGLIQNAWHIPEGGDNEWGIKGAKDMYIQANASAYEVIILSVGSGNTFKAFHSMLSEGQTLIGIIPMKINALEYSRNLKLNYQKNTKLIVADRWGRFGQFNSELIQFIELINQQYQIELDRIYNGKSFYELIHNIELHKLIQNKKTLYVHTGGIQGNR